MLGHGKKVDCLEWLRMAHICRQWREIALNQPLFWSYFDFTTVSPAGAAEILARAKSVPLHLEAMYLLDAGTTLGLAHSKKISETTSPTYVILTLAQNLPTLLGHSPVSLRLLPHLNTFL